MSYAAGSWIRNKAVFGRLRRAGATVRRMKTSFAVRSGARFARRDDPVGELPILRAVDIDRPFRERHQYRRGGDADGARQRPQHRAQGEQPALVEEEGEDAEGADQAARLLAELPARIEHPGAVEAL